jgi:hypothetical protein
MPLPATIDPLLLPDMEPLELPELPELAVLAPELLLLEGDPPLLLPAEREPLPLPATIPDEPPVAAPPLEPVPDLLPVPAVVPVPEPLVFVVPPVEVAPLAGFWFVAPVLLGIGVLFQRVDELGAGLEHSHTPQQPSATTTHPTSRVGTIHSVFRIFTSSNRQDLR